MDVRVRATNFELSAQVNDYTEERLLTIRRILGATEGPSRCEVELGRSSGHSQQGDVWFAEINLYPSDGTHYFARATAESVNAAVDLVKDEIGNQIRKHKQVERGALKKNGSLLKRLLRRE